jgi:SOS-response transcriptional repressor LexA
VDLPKTIRLPFDPRWAFNLPKSARFQIWVLDGKCMEPTLMHGDLIFVRKLTPRHGNIVAAFVDGQKMIKRYLVIDRKPLLRPDNPAHPDPTWEREMKVLGVVIGSCRSLRSCQRITGKRVVADAEVAL